MGKTAGKRKSKAVKGKAPVSAAIIKRARKKRHINNAALAVARWLN
jgi:hypothetical protein